MKKTTITLAALTLGATLVLAAPGHGPGAERHGRHGKGAFAARMAEKLDLTDVQKDQMKQLHEQFRADNEALFSAVRDTRTQLREARRAGNTALASTLAAQAEEQRAEMREKRQVLHDRIQQILTAEQRAELEAMKAQRAERWKERHQKRHGGQ